MNNPPPIHRVTPEAVRSRRHADEGLDEAKSARGRGGNREVERRRRCPSSRVARSDPRLLNVGYGNLVAAARVVAIVAPNASPMRRLRHEAAERGKLVDVTEGRRTRAIVLLDSDHVVLSAINPETLAARLAGGDAEPRA